MPAEEGPTRSGPGFRTPTARKAARPGGISPRALACGAELLKSPGLERMVGTSTLQLVVEQDVFVFALRAGPGPIAYF